MIVANENRPSDSPYIERVYRSDGLSPATRMRSVANAHWELAVWEAQGRVNVAVRGPETKPTSVVVTTEASHFGIVFAHGAAMPHLPVSRLVDSAVLASHVTSDTLVLRGEEWPLPSFGNAEDFVNRLVRTGVLVRDPLVADVVAGEDALRPGARSVQRRVVGTTGLTLATIRQIERARYAAVLLSEDVAPLEVVHRLGYYDQPHLAHSLTRFMGRTATELRQPNADEPLSLLYKTGE